MGALTLLAAIALSQWQPQIAEASARCGVPETWIARVMSAESGGRTMVDGMPIRSVKGAIGLMQLMPGTWAEMRVELDLGSNPDDPRDNVIAGACYLRRMFDRFGYPGLFAAYNAGPARYAAYLEGRSRLPAETVSYLAQVSGQPAVTPPAAPQPMPQTIFVVRHALPAASPAANEPSALFVIRRATE